MRTLGTSVLVALLAIVLTVGGCVWYKGRLIRPRIIPEIEADTPADTVNPVRRTSSEQPPPGSLPGGQSSSTGQPSGSSHITTLTGRDWSGTITRFQKAYDASGKPRIAVFLNRALSDEVRDWAMDDGWVFYAETTGKGGWRGEGYYVEPVDESGARPSPREYWMWAFEDGFIEPFTETGAKLIDRATILRLTAAQEQGKQGTLRPLAPKKVETNALVGYADIFIEVLISTDPKSLFGHVFKATAKEVKTGRLLANVTSVSWERDAAQEEYVGTPHGYKKVKKTAKPPKLQETARTLALETLSAVARTWGQ